MHILLMYLPLPPPPTSPPPPPPSYRVYCIMGDGESAEGSVWEAASFASYYKLDNLVAILDINRLGQSQPAALEHKVEVYQARMAAFGFNAIIVDGHDVESLCRAFFDAENCKDKPTCLVCKTLKGESLLDQGTGLSCEGTRAHNKGH